MRAQNSDEKIGQDSLEYQWERFSVSLGIFLTSINSDISLQGQERGLGVSVNLEDALGLTTSSFVVRGEAEYNFGSKMRSHVRVGYFGLIRNADKTLEQEITIGDEVYPIGTEVSSRYDMHIIRTLYDYAYFRDERINLALSVGLYIMPMNFSIGIDNIIDESAKFVAPLPVVGFRNTFFITPRILIKQNAEFLYFSTSSFLGSITDVNVWLEYNPFKHWGLGLGMNTFRYHFSATEQIGENLNFEGSLKTGFTGLLLYGKYYF
jgi:hypothetical protein